jgi:hypothetical protein
MDKVYAVFAPNGIGVPGLAELGIPPIDNICEADALPGLPLLF